MLPTCSGLAENSGTSADRGGKQVKFDSGKSVDRGGNQVKFDSANPADSRSLKVKFDRCTFKARLTDGGALFARMLH